MSHAPQWMNRRHFPCSSFATTSDRSTLVDKPTIMLRSVSYPSAKTKITCGTTKRMYLSLDRTCPYLPQ
jgi:hypothetical protein